MRDGKIRAPEPGCFLDGVTRQSVTGLAKTRQIDMIERAIQPDEMSGFEQRFITGTAAEVAPVSETGPRKFTPGQITQTLMGDYDKLIRSK